MITIIRFIKKLLKNPVVNKPVINAKYIIQRKDHKVSKTDISDNAIKVLNKLNNAGFQAYLVGGSVRDLMLQKAPKDFDIATNATPTQIRNLFRNARIIGRRFKLAHIIYHREIIEVATFRGHEDTDENHKTNDKGMLIRDNVYGTLEEDAWRRDFTINSLYYNIQDSSIIDFTGGVSDVTQKHIRMIGQPDTRYQEDPVRMLRAIRFSAKLKFDISPETANPIYELNTLITHISGSRLFDEMTKLYQCGAAIKAHQLLVNFNLFKHLFAQTHLLLDSKKYPMKAFLTIALENTDKRISEDKPVTPAFLFAVFLWFPFLAKVESLKNQGIDPLPAIDQAMSFVIKEQNNVVTIPKRYTQAIREIWMMQYRLPKRLGHRSYYLLQHPRFRAAYDFLVMRALVGDESVALADWWTTFQAVEDSKKEEMIAALATSTPETPKRRRQSLPPK